MINKHQIQKSDIHLQIHVSSKIFWIWTLLTLCITSATFGQNRASYHIELGTRTPVNTMDFGMAVQTDIKISSHIKIDGGIRIANQYPSKFGDIQAGVTIYPSKKSEKWAINNRITFSNYSPYPMNHLYYLLTGKWTTNHFYIELGNAFACYLGSGVVKYHLYNPSFMLQGNIRDKDKLWNIALFIRNFNHFEVHGSKCMEWGSNISARIYKKWKLFCEPYVVTVGNFNGTATFYNFNCLIGCSYEW